MRESVLEGRGRWTVAAGGALVVMTAVLLLFRLPAPPTPLSVPKLPSPAKATVKMAPPDGSDVLLREEAQLRDLRPLFLPTERNAALPEPRLEPGRTFLDNETLKLAFSDAEAQVSKDLPATVTLGGKLVNKATAVDALGVRESGVMLQGFGRSEAATTHFPTRGGYVEVTALKDGTKVLGQALSIDARPGGGKSWVPVEFIAVVDAAGLVGPLVVTDGSRVEEVDSHFRYYLAQNFRIGEQLPPGFYRITVAP